MYIGVITTRVYSITKML